MQSSFFDQMITDNNCQPSTISRLLLLVTTRPSRAIKARQAEEEESESADSSSGEESDDNSMDFDEEPLQKPDLKTMPARKGCPAVISEKTRAAFDADHPKSRNKRHDKDDADFVPGSD